MEGPTLLPAIRKLSGYKTDLLTHGDKALVSQEILDPVLVDLEEVPWDGHRRLVSCSCLQSLHTPESLKSILAKY